ncbi:hypothetical protein [Lentzea guizhouensis]|uniref:hypothetical protein n=1 Tax=Lentzea guizhouensis TaxID=1586287 RepID=UPI0012B69B8F|nr:hypothetical protein [Lentzea guizhouensis]
MNDFLMAAASATADAPDPASLEVLTEAGLDVAADEAVDGTVNGFVDEQERAG